MTPPESLTEEERASVELTISVLSKSSGAYPALAKLLRIHDRLQGEVEMLRVQQGRYAMAIERLEGEVRELTGREQECRGHWKDCLDARERVINLGARQAQELKAARARIVDLEAAACELRDHREEHGGSWT